jgi:hypothetical protein
VVEWGQALKVGGVNVASPVGELAVSGLPATPQEFTTMAFAEYGGCVEARGGRAHTDRELR